LLQGRFKMFLDVYEDHNKEFQGSSAGVQKYKTIKGYVAEFLNYKYAISDIEINRID